MKESKIEKEVSDFAEEMGFIRRKFTSPGHAAVPDDIYFGDEGLMFMIEFKKPGEKPRPNQQREIDLLRSKGHMVFVVDNIDYGKGIILGLVK